MGAAIATFLASGAAIVVAGVFLTRAADAIAELTGFGRLLVGSVLLAGATSLPELAVNVSAIRLGQPDLAAGNLFGSCLCNLLILAALDLTRYSRGAMLSPLASAHAVSGLMTIGLASVAAVAVAARPGPAWEVVGFGAGSLAILGVYLGGVRMVYHDQREACRPDGPSPGQSVLIPPAPGATLGRSAATFALATAAILVASPFLARASDELAEQTGLGHSFVGTALLAACTSLPEAVATLMALRLGAFDLALGNVFGSNSFNLATFGLLDVFQPGPLTSAVAPVHAVTGLAVILVTSVAVLGQLYQVAPRSRVPFLEPGGLLVVALVLGAMYLVYAIG